MGALVRYIGVDRESELELVARLKAGDLAAFDTVYEAFNARLFSFLARLTRRRDRAEDLLEETWLRLVTHRERLDAQSRLGPWLFTVARNLYLSSCRVQLFEEVPLPDGINLWPVSNAASPFEETAASEFEARMERGLASLPRIYREALLLVGVEGFEPGEAATICGITGAAMRQRLKRARDLLARKLESTAVAVGVLRAVNS